MKEVYKGTVDDFASAFIKSGDLSPVPLKRDVIFWLFKCSYKSVVFYFTFNCNEKIKYVIGDTL